MFINTPARNGKCIAVAVAIWLGASAAGAESLGTPTGEVVLTVSGAVTATNAEETAVFDLAMLQDLGVTGFTTTTIWTEGPQVFEGVSLKVLLDRLGVEDGMVIATAINDYAIEIPVSDAVEGGPIVAYSLNGAPMSVRDKGPLWIVYPFDQNAAYQTEVTYSRSIWQLDRIEVAK